MKWVQNGENGDCPLLGDCPLPDPNRGQSPRTKRGQSPTGDSPYWIVLETAPVGALSTPAFVYDANVKYHVPEESPSIVTVVVAGFAMSRTWVSVPGVWP